MDNVEENDANHDEMCQAERMRRCEELGKLPLTHGLIIIQVDENKDMAFSIDGLAPYEAFGLIDIMKIRLTAMLMMSYQENVKVTDGEETPEEYKM